MAEDSAEVRLWKRIGACLVAAIIYLVSWLQGVYDKKDAENKRLNDKLSEQNETARKMDFERARSWEALYYETGKAIHFSDTTASRRNDFESPAQFRQPGNTDGQH